MQHFISLPIKSQGNDSAFFYSYFSLSPLCSSGVFHFPMGDAQVSWIDARDVASTAATILLWLVPFAILCSVPSANEITSEDDDKFKNCKFYLTGQESLSCETTAEIFSRILSKRVQYIGK